MTRCFNYKYQITIEGYGPPLQILSMPSPSEKGMCRILKFKTTSLVFEILGFKTGMYLLQSLFYQNINFWIDIKKTKWSYDVLTSLVYELYFYELNELDSVTVRPLINVPLVNVAFFVPQFVSFFVFVVKTSN